MARAMAPVRARTIVAGHIHHPWKGEWEGKQLVIGGSVGLPHHGSPEAEYALLTHFDGSWQIELRSVPYDQAAALKEYRESAAFIEGGPIAWLLYDELLSCRARLALFLPEVSSMQAPDGPPKTLAQWEQAARRFLERIGRWTELHPVIQATQASRK
jgi:hypothetical protein